MKTANVPRRNKMRHRTSGLVFMLIMLGIAGASAGVAVYTNYASDASEAGLQEALSILPSDCEFVLGINVQKIVLSPAYEKFRQRQDQRMGSQMTEFMEKTGVDPARDVFYLVAAARSISLPVSGASAEKTSGKGVVVITGRFNGSAIADFIRSKTTPIEMKYEGQSILLIPESNKETADKGIVLLGDREIALGDLESLKAVLDVRETGKPGISSNFTMTHLINGIGPDEMVWFAGDTSRVLAKAPTTTPLGENIATIQNIVGALSITEAVTGRITATVINADSAVKLADVGRGFVALAQLAGDKNPDLKTLLSGLRVSQNDTQVSVAVDFPIDLLDKLGSLRKLPEKTIGN
jgi:hypothetical protein